MTALDLTQWFELIAAAGAAAVVIWGAYQLVMRRMVRPFRRRMAAIEDLVQLLPGLDDLMRQELQPNGGSSMRDEVTRIDQGQRQSERHFKSIERRLSEALRRIAKVEEQVTGGKEEE